MLTLGTAPAFPGKRLFCHVSSMTDTPTPVVTIGSGQLRGLGGNGIRTFLGVPYADPPARFELPRARTPWTGIFDAVDRGPAAPHRIRDLPQIDAVPPVGSGSDGGDGGTI